jgi:micrococcal nuclease
MQCREFECFRCFAQSIRAQAAIKLVAVLILSVALLLAAQTVAATPTGVSGTVTRVIDGDTIWVQTSAKIKPLKVRIQAIDAPEICQTGGVAARDALKARVLGKSVTLMPRARDAYNRVVASVDLQGADIGRWLVNGGHAWSSGYFQSAGPYASEQMQAQIARRGVFGGGKPEHPHDFRKRHGSCYVR